MYDLFTFAVAHPFCTAAVIVFCRLYIFAAAVELAIVEELAAEELATDQAIAEAIRLYVEEQDPGPCPSREVLAAYQADELAAPAAEELLNHFCLCRSCTDLYLAEYCADELADEAHPGELAEAA